MKAVFIIATAVALTGCATSKQITGPNGVAAHSIRCGSARIDLCYEKAAELCPSGYSFLDRNQSGNMVAMPVGNTLVFGAGPNTIFVQCKS